MKQLNIYMTGVGGQGIGLLSEVMSRAFYKLGKPVKAVDTHGLAQRGGSVVSQLRVGENVFSPLIMPGRADIILSLERLEALRAMAEMLKPGGKVLYYDANFQTIDNRLGKDQYPGIAELTELASKKNAEILRAFKEDLPDARMQNVVLLGVLAKANWIEGFTIDLVDEILKETIPAKIYESNRKILGAI
ncbi:MAG: indolepyruvate oxidoreductase subunit beta [Fidelibacterota bacterium]